FQLRLGEVLGLVGPNGAGKTTTLRCLAGIIPPTSGRIVIGGRDLQGQPVAPKRALAFLPDEPRLFDYLTVREHLNLIARLYAVAHRPSTANALLHPLQPKSNQPALP